MSLKHDLDRPLEDLKEIKKSLPENVIFKPTVELIDKKIAEYETDIEAVEEYLRSEDSKKYGLPMGTVNFNGE
jgi:hypothetical protein|tara:strand:+ start:796 stop:1014 length:219 start_codon:yes stop_codon:yes gene_type:complete